MMLTQLADIARRTGYPVTEVPGWKTRGHGPMVDVRTITVHHTGGPGPGHGDYPSLGTVRDGRRSPDPAADLPGPLAQLGVGRSGRIYVVAAGLSYHAGKSLADRFRNPYAVGIEAEAAGTPGAAGDWPPVQLDSLARLCAALVDAFDLSVADVRGHKETAAPAGRKVDPSFPMGGFRDRVATVNLKRLPTAKEDSMPTPDELTKIVRTQIIDVMKTEKIVPNRPTAAELAKNPHAVVTFMTVTAALANIEGDDDNRSARLEGKVDKLTGLVEAALKSPTGRV